MPACVLGCHMNVEGIRERRERALSTGEDGRSAACSSAFCRRSTSAASAAAAWVSSTAARAAWRAPLAALAAISSRCVSLSGSELASPSSPEPAAASSLCLRCISYSACSIAMPQR